MTSSDTPQSLPKRFGSFSGVFVPTFLSIIGVILFLRLGTVVGNAGAFGAVLIVLLATSITFCTGLALSSITTNIRIGSGAAYSIISKTLGLEVGGSVGIPLYLAQVFSVALYLLGFAEAWLFLFPDHPFKAVVVGAFAALALLTAISTAIAIRAQQVVFVVVIAALVSIFMGGGNWITNILDTPLLGSFPETSFWSMFALFFPAVTGLMAGIGLSGELTDPKRQIPRGVLSSLLITTIIYLAMIFWLSHSASPADLLGNSLIIVELAANGPIVLLGILAATFSSALTTFIAAPRLLHSLSRNSIVPFSDRLSVLHKGEPRNTTIVTGVVVVSAILLGSLDSIAPVLTMFFLITYAMINTVVFIEQSLGLPSFRPTFRVPRFVPLYGAVGSIAFMFLISAPAGLIAITFLVGMYLTLVRRHLNAKEGDVRSGLFRTLSEWAARKVQSLPESTQHTWKPNILLPALSNADLLGNFPLIKAIAYPKGTMTVLGMQIKSKRSQPKTDDDQQTSMNTDQLQDLSIIVDKFGEEGIFTFYSTIEADDYSKAIAVGLSAIESQIFHPNILLLPYKPRQFTKTQLTRIYESVTRNDVSIMLFDRDEELGLGSQNDIHVWISPDVLEEDFYSDQRNFDLALLVAYKLRNNWNGVMNLWMCVDESKKTAAQNYLKKLLYEGRLPQDTQLRVETGSFLKTLEHAPDGDIHLISLTGKSLDHLKKIAKLKGKSFLFVSDSSHEDVLA